MADNTETPVPEFVAPPPEASAIPATAGKSRVLSLRSPLYLVAAALAVLLLWQWLDTRARMEGLRQDFARRLVESDVQVRDSKALAKENQALAASLQARLDSLEADFSASQSQQVALESMYQELSRTRDERLLAEVEQSITIAAQQLQLAGNIEVALIALNGADARLAKAAQPQFLPLRKLIARDIARLTTLPVADISGMALKIETIIAQVDSFPMAFEQRPSVADVRAANKAQSKSEPRPQPAWWQALLGDLWAETRQLIRIERVDRADPGLLPPAQAYFLRENIKLRLLNARLALLARDGRSFREDTRQTAEWLDRYFDTQSRPVQSALATVKGFAELDIVQQAPSLNETLTAVRTFKLGRK